MVNNRKTVNRKACALPAAKRAAALFAAVLLLAAAFGSLTACKGFPAPTADNIPKSTTASTQPPDVVAAEVSPTPEATAPPTEEPTAAATEEPTPEPTLPPETVEPTPKPTPAPKALAMPKNGYVFLHTKARRVAPLNITVPAGKTYYYIMLKDKATQKQALAVIVYPGKTVKIKMPLGTFRLYYAMGKKWYGEKALFGENTQYYATEDDFKFTKSSGGYNGYSVELVEQAGGNLGFEEVDGSEFSS